MDVYHKVLHKLCEATEGKTSKTVNFKDLVKRLGFVGSYLEIYNFLSGEGWVAESPKADFVFLTHWGLAEVKKNSSAADGDSDETIKIYADQAINTCGELSKLLENFAGNSEMKNFPQIEKKLSELQNILDQVKNE